MTRKQYYAIKAREEKERIEQIFRDYPVERVRELLAEGLSDEEAGKRLEIDALDFKVLVVLYRCKGDL